MCEALGVGPCGLTDEGGRAALAFDGLAIHEDSEGTLTEDVTAAGIEKIGVLDGDARIDRTM